MQVGSETWFLSDEVSFGGRPVLVSWLVVLRTRSTGAVERYRPESASVSTLRVAARRGGGDAHLQQKSKSALSATSIPIIETSLTELQRSSKA